jgi:nicotinamide-nucleotide amidase
MQRELRLVAAFPDATAAAGALRAAHLAVAVGESCTGGLVGATLTAVPGASDYMRGGVIAYTDAAKSDVLSVSRDLIAQFGAVSQAVARAMADGARERFRADIGVGVTGIAGPSGGRAGKPVGLIFVCVAGRAGVWSERLEGDHGREENRSRAVEAALRLCILAASAGPG